MNVTDEKDTGGRTRGKEGEGSGLGGEEEGGTGVEDGGGETGGGTADYIPTGNAKCACAGCVAAAHVSGSGSAEQGAFETIEMCCAFIFLKTLIPYLHATCVDAVVTFLGRFLIRMKTLYIHNTG